MPKTLGVSGDPPDLDGTLVDGLTSLRQRVVQAILLRTNDWFLATNRGIPRDVLTGHATSGIAAAAITAAIRLEGGAEVKGVQNVRYSLTRRRFAYTAEVETIYGRMDIDEQLNL